MNHHRHNTPACHNSDSISQNIQESVAVAVHIRIESAEKPTDMLKVDTAKPVGAAGTRHHVWRTSRLSIDKTGCSGCR